MARCGFKSFAELGDIVPAIEQALTAFTDYERINYLMLMMVDRQVHFHVIPRYDASADWRRDVCRYRLPDRRPQIRGLRPTADILLVCKLL